MNSLRFYFRLAYSNIKKNLRLYIPNIMAGAGIISVFFIMVSILFDPNLLKGRGRTYLPTIMQLGSVVTGLLGVLMIFYTDSFIMKQRKREFGLYNVLGMNKKNIGHVLFFEKVISSVISIFSGIALGLVLYKLCVLFICNIFKIETIMGFYVSIEAVIITLIFFVAVYLITYIFNRMQIHFLKPVEMLHAVNMGEREPKIKFLILLLGLASMGCGYYIALTTNSPLKALNSLFIAILLVIIGTYFLFMAGTITVLKILKAKKSYYYHPEHMMAVSGLLYRMKQNAAGLASICIMSTAVLVMLSTTVSLYAGIGDSIKTHYQHDIYISGKFVKPEWYETDKKHEDSGIIFRQNYMEAVVEAAKEKNISLKIDTQDYLDLAMCYEDGNYTLSVSEDLLSISKIEAFKIMSAKEYERITGRNLNLTGNQVMYKFMSGNGDAKRELENFSIDGMDFVCVGKIDEVPVSLEGYTIFQSYFMVVSDDDILNSLKNLQNKIYRKNDIRQNCEVEHLILLDYEDKLSEEEKEKFEAYLSNKVSEVYSRIRDNAMDKENGLGSIYNFKSKAESYSEMLSMIGGFLFLGILLGMVFVFATAIVIYYKQISEGYEDRHRFQIMQKVGMSEKEIKKTIKTQILLVFFLPLIMAVIHLAAAFRILSLLLSLFFLPNNMLFLICAVISVIVFGVVYGIIYILTAKTYHRLVT